VNIFISIALETWKKFTQKLFQLCNCDARVRSTLIHFFIYLFWFLFYLQTIEDWKFVAMVLDRFFLLVFFLSCVGGTLGIIFESPSLYGMCPIIAILILKKIIIISFFSDTDTRSPIDRQLSEIPLRKSNFMLPPDIVRVNFD
jgi:fatty acid desaturase